MINKNLLLIYFVHGGTASFKYRYSNLFNIIAFSTFDYIICLFNNYKKKKIYNLSIKKKILNKIFNFNWNKNKNKIKIINNPLTFKSKKKSQCKNKIVLSVGRLDKNKNHNFLIDAWKEIIKNNDDWKLYIIGDGTEKEMLNEKIQLFNLNKSVKVINEIKNIKRYYLNSSIFVSTSLDEGLSLSILEAMECGLPIVSSPTYGAKYLIRNNINGFIYKKFNNPNNFVKKINILMNNKILRSKFSLASIRLAQFYNIKNLSSQWKSIIKN